ncbi:FG-GAP-like repeat-containing protein [Streptomyces sp. MST-110588]|uniref:FG-GAP-like repeat-containing protein n=1 Tax=Streptomyces sp. MST-110588 TaxID=2833628 RepID=UPI002063EF3C|nr:FG-GAP-like repeat-containing protein [Streptomyces sp. MST-110588]UNO41740.1 VCBS repeat-containing protein [Streptomyces sp. MST-110588]
MTAARIPKSARTAIAISVLALAAGSVSVSGANAASVSTWDKVAQCESSGNWSINNGNGFSGGLQFTLSTWRAFGGTKYAPMAYQATKKQQILIAEKVLAVQGPGAWPNCGRKNGLGTDHADPYPERPEYEVGMHDLVSGDFNGDGKSDVIGVQQDKGELWFYAGDGEGSIGGGRTRKLIGTNWNSMQDLTAGDFNGDGKTDVVGVETDSGKLWLYPGDGKGGIGGESTRKEIGSNWTTMRELTAGDFNGDGKVDLLAVQNKDGSLWLYAGDGKGSIAGGGARKQMGTNWNTMQDLTAGDFNGDGKVDLIGVEESSEMLWLYTGDGKGGIGGESTRKKIGTNWTSMRELTAEDYNGDGKVDVLAVENENKKLWFYAGDGTGSIGGGATRKNIGSNW